MVTFETCKDYSCIVEGYFGMDAISAAEECDRLERERNDGYCVIACENGCIIASADGPRESEGGPPYDAATATGMYDRDF